MHFRCFHFPRHNIECVVFVLCLRPTHQRRCCFGNDKAVAKGELSGSDAAKLISEEPCNSCSPCGGCYVEGPTWVVNVLIRSDGSAGQGDV
jgi:hypothetical protein